MLQLAFNPGLTLTGFRITWPWQAKFRTVMSKNWKHTLYISVKQGGGGRGGGGGEGKAPTKTTLQKHQERCKPLAEKAMTIKIVDLLPVVTILVLISVAEPISN